MRVLLDTNILTRSVQPAHPMHKTALDAVSILKTRGEDLCIVQQPYEDEVRIIQQKGWYRLSKPVERIIVGHRFDKGLLQALRMVCERKNITLNCTRPDNGGVVAIDCIEI
jgi:hypothetical protein